MKNDFCQGDLPPDEVTIVHLPSGDPDTLKDKYWLLTKTLYGLSHSPCHWYQKIDSILRSIGLLPSPHDPCIYIGIIRDPHHPSSPGTSTSPLSLGLYVDDFVYFSKDHAVEQLFKCLLHQQIKVEFVGLTEWFWGIHYSWRVTDSEVAVHLNQSGYAANLVEQFLQYSWNPTPTATPYHFGVPVDSVALSTNDDSSPAQLRRTGPIKASLEALVGLLLPHILTYPLLTPSSLSIMVNHPPVTRVLHYTHCTTFI